jgi:glycosyltransferase involved in cell wall biosynthesis
VHEQLPLLARHAEVVAVVEDPRAVDPADLEGVTLAAANERPLADLDLYHVGNSPAHVFVYRAALQRAGVVVLHEWSLQQLVLAATVETGDTAAYVREMRRDHGADGAFVARQVARGLGGDALPSIFPLNERLLEASLAVVGLTCDIVEQARRRVRRRPVLHLMHHASLPAHPLPTRNEARRALGLAAEDLIVTAPGLATRSKRLDVALDVIARLRKRHRRLRLVVAGGIDRELPLVEWVRSADLEAAVTTTGRLSLGDFVRHLVAADVLLALRYPSRGEMSGALVRSLGIGRPVLVTAGTPAADEFPEGIVVPVDPGPAESAELEAVLDRLLGDAVLRETIGRLAREHVRGTCDPETTVAELAAFLAHVAGVRSALDSETEAHRLPEAGLLGLWLTEVRRASLDLGLYEVPAAVVAGVSELLGSDA